MCYPSPWDTVVFSTKPPPVAYLPIFPGLADIGIFALAAMSLCFFPASSCFLALSFDFGDLSPIAIPLSVEETKASPIFGLKSMTIAIDEKRLQS